jgi:hypothetical protein
MFEASIFDSIGGFLSDKGLEALGALLMLYLAVFVKKEILPLLQVRRNREVAEHILIIADDVTDYFRLKFPSAHWSVWLDRAVDRIIEITGVGRDVADRAAKAAVARKGEPAKAAQ